MISLKTMIRIPQVCGQGDGFDLDRWENFVMPKPDKQDQRIADIFGMKVVPDVTDETLEIYLDYLKQHLEMSCQLTGIEDFSWEEIYVIGPGDKAEHERLRKTQPSYLDTYELLSFDGDYDEDYGLVVNVRRLSDKKKFALTLSDLRASDEKSNNYKLLDDFSVWFVNYR